MVGSFRSAAVTVADHKEQSFLMAVGGLKKEFQMSGDAAQRGHLGRGKRSAGDGKRDHQILNVLAGSFERGAFGNLQARQIYKSNAGNESGPTQKIVGPRGSGIAAWGQNAVFNDKSDPGRGSELRGGALLDYDIIERVVSAPVEFGARRIEACLLDELRGIGRERIP